jgi:rhodanese-related sulfurtransferase
MTMRKSTATVAVVAGLCLSGMVQALEVNITADLPSLEVLHNGRKVTVMRNQDPNNSINPAYAKTSRKCPPFCIQPMELASGVRTIGELEMLRFLKQMSNGDRSVLVVDSRSQDSVDRGTIPGSVNIPAARLDSSEADPVAIREILEKQFGAKRRNGSWDFSGARTLVLFCNGPWCGQSPANIMALLGLGYPARKLVWYRGGMQDWEAMGLTTVKSSQW